VRDGFAALHPSVCFFYYAGVFLFSMLLLHPLFLGTLFIIAILLNLIQDGGQRLVKSWAFYIVMGTAVVLLNPVFSDRGVTILFYLRNKPITLESVVFGITMALSLLTILIIFHSYNLVITIDKFLFLFASFFPKGAFLAMLSIRFVSLLKTRFQQILIIQKTRGRDIYKGTVKKRLKDGMQLLIILVTWSFEEALQTAESMKSRGYGTGKRSFYFPYKMDRHNWIILFILILTGGAAVMGSFFGYGRMDIYPHIGSRPFTYYSWIFYGLFCLYLLIPVFLEGREKIRWRLLK
jgi:energy-coupling factor transport system permease protein